jgi:hypothetical protein
MAPRNSPELAMLYGRAKQKGNANRYSISSLVRWEYANGMLPSMSVCGRRFLHPRLLSCLFTVAAYSADKWNTLFRSCLKRLGDKKCHSQNPLKVSASPVIGSVREALLCFYMAGPATGTITTLWRQCWLRLPR